MSLVIDRYQLDYEPEQVSRMRWLTALDLKEDELVETIHKISDVPTGFIRERMRECEFTTIPTPELVAEHPVLGEFRVKFTPIGVHDSIVHGLIEDTDPRDRLLAHVRRRYENTGMVEEQGMLSVVEDGFCCLTWLAFNAATRSVELVIASIQGDIEDLPAVEELIDKHQR